MSALPDNEILREAGTLAGDESPELKRELGTFQVFAISFAFISVAVGVFGTYDEVLQTAGPVGIWLWVVVAAGQILVALIMAQFAARIALTGSAYQWASRLADPKIGWWFGWLTFCYLAIGVVAVDNALASQALMPLLAIAPDETLARGITVAVLCVQAVLAVGSTRLVALLNSAAVGVEIGVVTVLAVGLLVAVAVTGLGSVDNLTSRGIVQHPDDLAAGGGLMSAMIMGLATLVGFDAAANLAEEAKDPYRTVPLAIVGSVIAAAVLGLVFLVALTIAIPDVTAITADPSPVAAILRAQMGRIGEVVLLVAVTFAFFACGTVVMVSGARLVFAMARDGRFPGHRLMRQVHPRTRTPAAATVLIFAGGVLLMLVLPGHALLQLITVSTILPVMIYAGTVILYLSVRGSLARREGAFDLGRFDRPVAFGALVWLALALFVLVAPAAAAVPVLVVGGLIALGGVFFFALMVFQRRAPDAAP